MQDLQAAIEDLVRKSQTAMARYQKKMKRVQPERCRINKKHADTLL